MKWLGGIAILCLVGAITLWSLARRDSACFWNLCYFDHLLNCASEVASAEEGGDVQDGVRTDTQYILGFCDDAELHCPSTGERYVLTFAVGGHPYCPSHGRLIEGYGFRVHETDPKQALNYPTAKRITYRLLFFLSFAFAAATAIASIVRSSRTREGPRQPPDGLDASTANEGDTALTR
jgi:hypothetical protein